MSFRTIMPHTSLQDCLERREGVTPPIPGYDSLTTANSSPEHLPQTDCGSKRPYSNEVREQGNLPLKKACYTEDWTATDIPDAAETLREFLQIALEQVKDKPDSQTRTDPLNIPLISPWIPQQELDLALQDTWADFLDDVQNPNTPTWITLDVVDNPDAADLLLPPDCENLSGPPDPPRVKILH